MRSSSGMQNIELMESDQCDRRDDSSVLLPLLSEVRMASSLTGESSNLRKTSLYKDIQANQWPIIYSTQYNIGFLYLERLHPFDSSKWGSIINFLRG